MSGFGFALGERDDHHIVCALVKPECGQFGIVGMGRNDQQALAGIVGLPEAMNPDFSGQPAMARVQGNRAGRFAETTRVDGEESPSVASALKIEPPIGQAEPGIEETAAEAGLDPALEHHGVGWRQGIRYMQPPIRHSGDAGPVGGKLMQIVTARAVEQMIGKPGFVRQPQNKRQRRQQPPAGISGKYQADQACNKHDQTLVASMPAKQALFVSLCHLHR